MFFRRNSKTFQLDEVLSGCLNGRPSAQKRLFEHFYGFSMSICLRYAANRTEAEEMLNDGFLKVFDKISYYDGKHAFEAWLRTVMVRSCIDYHRKYHKNVVFVDVDDAAAGHHAQLSHQDDSLDRLSAEEIMALVQKLPPAYRTVFSLYVVEGYSHQEIADLLKINEGTSRSNLAKARIKLQEWVNIYVSDSSTSYGHVRK